MPKSCAPGSCAISPAISIRNSPISASCAGRPTSIQACRPRWPLIWNGNGRGEMTKQRNRVPMKLAKIVKHCRIDKPRHFKLADHDPAERFGLSTDIEEVKHILADGVARMEELQQRLYAQGRWGVLIVLQGMDAAGKDGVVKHVMSGIDPQGCEGHSFKAPSAEELAHDFLWRIGRVVPARGRIGIFNRSHYEEVLVVRVHPDLLERQNLPPSATGKK